MKPQPGRTATARGLLLITTALAMGTTADAASFTLGASNYWGDTTAPGGWYNEDLNAFGLLPGSFDDANASVACDLIAPCATLRMENLSSLGGGPVSATVRSLDAAGRRLIFGPGSYLWPVDGGQASGLTMNGGTLVAGRPGSRRFTITGPVLIEYGGVLNPSLIGGNPVLQGSTQVQGTLEFRNASDGAEVTNSGHFVQTFTTGNTLFWGKMDFRNASGGIVELQNDNGLRSEPSSLATKSDLVFHNEAGATLSKTGGTGISVVELPIVNNGTVLATNGQLMLAGGGIHGTSSWQSIGSAAIGLLGSHTIEGTVTSTATVYLGDTADTPASLTIADGGVLDNQGSLWQVFPTSLLQTQVTVGAGGRMLNAGSMRFVNMGIEAGGEFENSGTVQLDYVDITGVNALVNEGSVTIAAGTVAGDGFYVQRGAGTTFIDETAGIFLGSGSQYIQEDGITTVRGTLQADTMHFLGG